MKRSGPPFPPRGIATPPEMHPDDLARPGTPARESDECPHCRGRGVVAGDSCPTCEGIGRLVNGAGAA